MQNFSDMVRAFPYPVLEDGNLSFSKGEYVLDIKFENDNSATINHRVENAPLINFFLESGKAAYCCTVSIPKTGYRKLFKSDASNQKIEWEAEWVGEPPILRPFIVCLEEIKHTLQKKDGVHEMWSGQEITFQKGAKLAIGFDFRPKSSMESLLSFSNDKTLGPGQMRIETCSDQGFYFNVKVASDLYQFVNNPGGDDRNKHSRSIKIHAASSCFSILAKDHSNTEGDESWQSHSNLLALAGEMENKNLKLWDDEGFRPEEAATNLYPHLIPDPSTEQD